MLRPALALFAVLAIGCAVRGSAQTATIVPEARWDPPRLDSDRRSTFEKLVPEIDKMLAEDQRASGAPGMAVGIVLGGETVYAKGFGLRDVDQKRPFTVDTPFPIASVTKSFTAMAILKLRDEGKVDLDGPAARYYPPLAKLSYPTRDAPPVTLRHLLTHSSGMPEDNPWADVTENLSDAELTALLEGGVMSRAPGVQYEYANVGYGVLGRVIERVSGIATREYIRRAVLDPLGMTQSGWEPQDFPSDAVAVGYRGREGVRDIEAPAVIAPAERLGVMDAAGGLYTTVRSLARYVAFHLTAWPPRDDPEKGPLRRSSVREMQQGVRSSSRAEFIPALVQRSPPAIARLGPDGLALDALSYGFGLQSHVTCEREVLIEHSGGLPGYQTRLTMLPEVGVGMVVFINDERSRSKAIDSVMKVLRASGLFVRRPVEPVPALADARTTVHELLTKWDDARALSAFEPTFFRYQTIETLKERFAKLSRDHGTCRFDGPPTFVNRLRASWRATCERGRVQFAAGLAPGPKPRLQAFDWREEMPPSSEMENAAAAMLKLLERWDTAAAAQWLAKAADVPKVERTFAKLAVVHGPCKMGPPVDGDGKQRATFLLSCQESPVELTILLEPSGKIAQASGRPPRLESRPNCAD
jgi:serine-type D-Ala-D-Ala carboxypeptidase/endopeptidase